MVILDNPYNMPKVNIFFDMDGVLVQYDETAYVGDNPLYTQIGEHYFKYLEPNDAAIKCLRLLAYEPWSNIYVCSKIAASTSTKIGREQYDDKRDWCSHNIHPKQCVRRFIIGHKGKPQSVELFFKRHLTHYDVLIDDYNPNLEQWEKRGGTAIKWLNGQNSADSWPGETLGDPKDTPNVIATKVLRAAHKPTLHDYAADTLTNTNSHGL